MADITARGLELRDQLKALRGKDAAEHQRLLAEYQAEVTRLGGAQDED